MKRVVVTGIGVISPIGNSYQEFKEALKEGKSGAADITLFDAEKFKTKFACEVKNFEPAQRIDKKSLRRMDRFAQFAMYAVAEAMEGAGIDLETLNKEMAGVIWGSGIGGLKSLEQEIEYNVTSELPKYNPFMIPKMISDIAAGLISIKYGFRGVNYATVTACASATHAMVSATDTIRLGKADIIIAGGSEASITKTGLGGFSSMKALSERNDSPQTASRPFDKNRDGFVLGEGGAALILESYEHAKARGANIIAEIGGGAMTADAYHMTAPHPEGLGAAKVMELCLKDARVNAEEVDYINVHGTSTPLGDIAEIQAIQNVFGDHTYNLNISSTKSMTGHLLGATGAVESIACIAGIKEGFVPPTINHSEADPKIDNKLNLTLNIPQERNLEVVLNNTFGFGGHNASILIKKFKNA